MYNPTQDAARFSQEFLDNAVQSMSRVTEGFQAIATEAADYSKKSYEDGARTVEKLAGAKDFEAAFEIQADYARTAYEGFVTEARKLGEMYADLAKVAYKPYEKSAS